MQKRMEPIADLTMEAGCRGASLQAKGLGGIRAPKRRAPYFNPGANESPDHASDRSGLVEGLTPSTPYEVLGARCCLILRLAGDLVSLGRWERGHARPGLHCLCETAWR